jgi:hypothetical protein
MRAEEGIQHSRSFMLEVAQQSIYEFKIMVSSLSLNNSLGSFYSDFSLSLLPIFLPGRLEITQATQGKNSCKNLCVFQNQGDQTGCGSGLLMFIATIRQFPFSFPYSSGLLMLIATYRVIRQYTTSIGDSLLTILAKVGNSLVPLGSRKMMVT